MNDWIIKAEELGKKYRINHQSRERYTALRDVLAHRAKRLLGLKQNASSPVVTEDFWALKNVSFEIKQGEVVGVIGRNGAGKSTLLKILSRITEPSLGRIRLRGRVASLLEVGTGFHPELTGRENIFLNGAILGMNRNEIRNQFDKIVDFAGVEAFLDTPVKRYSSGMYVRLAFAVAAHLEPEILVVDEVLAVGDAQFQRKCLGKLSEVAKSGRTVLFVSHNLAQVQRLTTKGILLSAGTLIEAGPINSVISRYTSSLITEGQTNDIPLALSSSDGTTHVTRVQIQGHDGSPLISTGNQLRITITLEFKRIFTNPGIAVSLRTDEGTELLRISTSPISGFDTGPCVGVLKAHLTIPEVPLAAGRYQIAIGVSVPNVSYLIPLVDIGRFTVEPNDYYNSGFAIENQFGCLVARHSWSLEKIASK